MLAERGACEGPPLFLSSCLPVGNLFHRRSPGGPHGVEAGSVGIVRRARSGWLRCGRPGLAWFAGIPYAMRVGRVPGTGGGRERERAGSQRRSRPFFGGSAFRSGGRLRREDYLSILRRRPARMRLLRMPFQRFSWETVTP